MGQRLGRGSGWGWPFCGPHALRVLCQPRGWSPETGGHAFLLCPWHISLSVFQEGTLWGKSGESWVVSPPPPSSTLHDRGSCRDGRAEARAVHVCMLGGTAWRGGRG